ncbi:polymorphic toxin-type HINT domain-containing protein [Parasulfitobacter algicola]|uniref:Hint domain-containing protein n=1 Tax=Parasulfitobacter algicola TaxID=2614809 RepID=A0ABX2IVM0_9RHOB|nr:polymorphic toxin-type HINT domain-containing protein [Sulfitobacter algicola]NSX56967.1 hypothetical protein [Sulfitobacter algicola]
MDTGRYISRCDVPADLKNNPFSHFGIGFGFGYNDARLREGDLVVARDEETGQSLVSPVTAVMKRQATDMLWLTLEDGSGQVSRLGVTAEHPLFAVGEGWLPAGEVTPGDQIRDKNLQVLTVLAAEADQTPRIVHNLEIDGPQTYFAGELEVWGHNARNKMIDHIIWWRARGRCECCGRAVPPPGTPGIPHGDKFSFEHNPAQSTGRSSDNATSGNKCYCVRCNSRHGNRDAGKPPSNREPF